MTKLIKIKVMKKDSEDIKIKDDDNDDEQIKNY